ncbi:hypothetical protein BP6252_08506 [Coleophoma cylindrospora]|uniref:Uncharacterized protein n=1 Tax=Coleophoma cylindrospora TaxID=1849047 RepID=A0A3D8R659_9HELO|nr:hypothetical protein BP6252_08506 [Coleophoma cylindrospora]
MAAINATKETKLYKGRTMFKWEDSPGLDHHCGICQKPFSKDSCKLTCVGKHAEPCYRYHQLLHFLGKAHECYACTTSDQMHYYRHKQIVILVRKIKELDSFEVSLSSPFAKKTTGEFAGGNRRRRLSGDDWSETFSDIFAEDNPKATKKRERKRSRNNGSGSTKDPEIFPKHDIDFVDEAIHCPETKPPISSDEVEEDCATPSIGEIQELMKESSGQFIPPPSPFRNTPQRLKMSSKTAKSQSPLLTMTHKYRYFGRQAKKVPKDYNETLQRLDPNILHRLGIDLGGNNSSKRKDLLSKLLDAISKDLEIFQQEEREAELRKQAFFRWAGRTGAMAMEAAHENYDWKTGILKKNDYKFPAPKPSPPFPGKNINQHKYNEPRKPNGANPPIKVKREQISAEKVYRSINVQGDPSDPDAKNGPVILRIIPPTFRNKPIDTSPRTAAPTKSKTKQKAIKKRQSARAQQILQAMLEEDHPRQKQVVVPMQDAVRKQEHVPQEQAVSQIHDEEKFAEEDLQFLVKMKHLRK